MRSALVEPNQADVLLHTITSKRRKATQAARERAGDNYELEERARVHTALYERRSQLRTFFKVCANTDEPYNTTTELAMNAVTVVPRRNLMRLRDHLYEVDFPAALANRERASCRALHSQRSPAVRASC